MKQEDKQKEVCKHPNAYIKVLSVACTVEELVDYCPDCGKEWNYRIEC